MSSVTVLQARTNSTRLPGKVLLPINGMPMVVLAVKRAANTGRDVVVATSEETTDDVLVRILDDYGIPYYRGSLNNTLDRIVASLIDYDDDILVFRLTADNVFPDGALLDKIEAEFITLGLNYMNCNGEDSGLPYGVSVELTRLRYLREAAKNTNCKYDQEHVTPYIKRKYGEHCFNKYKHLKKGHYRCTVDSFDDYMAVSQVFSKVKDSINIATHALIEMLNDVQFQPLKPTVAGKLVLGTAQLGMHYGISNEKGQPDNLTAERLIKLAIVNGSSFIDTANAYGNSEKVIGDSLRCGWQGRVKVITKLSPLATCPDDASKDVVNAFVDASVYQSSSNLAAKSLDVVMLHRAKHMFDWQGNVWNRLLFHKANGYIKELGVSVQNPDELVSALEMPEVNFIQMPFNVLDWRWNKLIPKIVMAKKKRKLLVHVRSALLQGLFISKNKEHWIKANVVEPERIINWLDQQSKVYGKRNVADFCLGYVKSFDWVDGVVVGMETVEQLEDNVKTLCADDLSRQELSAVLVGRPLLDERTLNPAYWNE